MTSADQICAGMGTRCSRRLVGLDTVPSALASTAWLSFARSTDSFSAKMDSLVMKAIVPLVNGIR